jgi:hypothetical protein
MEHTQEQHIEDYKAATEEIQKMDPIDKEKQMEQLNAAFVASELHRLKTSGIVPKWDSKNRFYDTRPGFRSNGPKKTRLINLVNQQFLQLTQKGVNIRPLLALLGITGDAVTYTTKEWTGVLSKIKTFRQENNV